MKQKIIKLPLTCSQLAISIWTILTILLLVYGIKNFSLTEINISIFLLPLGITSLLCMLIFVLPGIIDVLREKPRLPFKFECRCDNE